MTNQTDIERIVMQRVHLIHALKFAVSSGVITTLLSILGLWGIGREVWVGHVLQNAPKNPLDLFQFYGAAFIHTRFIVQMLIVFTLAALLYVVYEIIRAVRVMSAVKSF